MAAASLTLPPDVVEALQRLADQRRQAVDDVALDLLRRALLAHPLPDPTVTIDELDRATAEAGAVLVSLAYREALQRATALPSFAAEDLWLAMAAHYGATLPVPTLQESRAISNLGLDLPLDDDDVKALRSWIERRKGAWPLAA